MHVLDEISKALLAHQEKMIDAIEEMAERMLVTPDAPGILVTHHGAPGTDYVVDDDGPRWAFTFPEFTVELHPDVPFGEIHHRLT